MTENLSLIIVKITVILALLIYVGVGYIGSHSYQFQVKTAAVATITTKNEKPLADWTFMIYLDADNNLEAAGIEDLNEMETVGSSPKVNFVVQMDRIPGYDISNGDWTDTRRFYVTQDADRNTINSAELELLGELNMGDPEVLVEFVLWAIENYPAKHYLLDLWDHGGSFWGVCWDETINETDESDELYDYLDMANLSYALAKIRAVLGRNIDILGFDACLMAEVSVLYEVKDFVDIVVASGYVEPGDGWPYELICDALVKDPGLSPEELATLIAEYYTRSYEAIKGYTIGAISMTAFDMQKFKLGAEKINRFAMFLATGGKNPYLLDVMKKAYYNELGLIRSRVESYSMLNIGPFDFDGYCMYDIIGFALNVSRSRTSIIHQDVKDSALQVVEQLKATIIHAAIDRGHPNANGLTIYFPNGVEDIQLPGVNIYDPEYSSLAFGLQLFWDDFLRDYFAVRPRKLARDTPPSCLILTPENIDTTIDLRDADTDIYLIEGLAFDIQSEPVVKLRIDDGNWHTLPVSNEHWSYELELSKLPLRERTSSHQITVYAVDSVGLESPKFTISITVITEKLPPEYKPWFYDIWFSLIIIVVAVVITLICDYLYRKRKKKVVAV